MSSDYTVNISFIVSRRGDGFERLEQEVNAIKRSMGQLSANTADSNRQMQSSLQKSGMRWTELKSKVDLAVGAIRTVYQVGQQVFQFLQDAAAVENTERKFDRLAQSIGTTADALQNDLGSVTGGLLSDFQAMEAATDFMTLGLARTHDEAVRLSNVSSQLGMNMNQLVLTLTNQTTMRFDALGLSVDGFDEKVANLKATGMDTNEAFKEAFLQQAEAQLERVGSVVDTNAGKLQILSSNWQNTTANMKQNILDAAAPIIDKFASIITTAGEAELAVKNLGQSSKFLDDLAIAAEKVSTAVEEVGAHGSFFSPVQTIKTRDAVKELAAQISAATGSVEEQRAKLESYGFTVDDIGVKLNGMGVSWIELAKAVEQVKLDKAAAEAAQYDIALQRVQTTTKGTTSATKLKALADLETAKIIEDHLIGLLKEEQAELKNLGGALNSATDDTAAMAEAQAQLAQMIQGTVDAQTSATSELFSAYDDLKAAQGEWVQATVDNSSTIAQISAELAGDLSDDQQDAYRDILDTVAEGSAEWLAAYDALQGDLTDSQRAGLIARLADLQDGHGQIQDIFTGDAEAAEEAQARIDSALVVIQQNYQNLALEIAQAKLAEAFGENATEIELALIGIKEQMGLISSDEADFLRGMVEKTDALGQSLDTMMDGFLADGELTEEELAQIAELVDAVSSSVTGSQSVIETMARMGVEEFNAMKEKIGEIPPQIEDIKDQAQAFEDGGPYMPTMDVNTGPASSKISDLSAEVDALLMKLAGAGGPIEEASQSASGSSGGSSNSGAGAGSGSAGGTQGPPMATGGFTGGKWGRYDPYEYIFNAQATRNIGVDNLEAIHEAAKRGPVGAIPPALSYSMGPHGVAQRSGVGGGSNVQVYNAPDNSNTFVVVPDRAAAAALVAQKEATRKSNFNRFALTGK